MSLADERPLRDLPDRTMRESLKDTANLRALITRAVPELAARFDFERARLLDPEFPLDDWRRREADLPFEIPFRAGDQQLPALVLLLIEHQSDTDPVMPLRLLYFAVNYWDRQWRQWEQLPRPREPLRLNPVLPLVFHTGPTRWGSNRNMADLLGEPFELHGFAPVWEPVIWNLADQTPEDLIGSEGDWLQMLAVLRAQAEDADSFASVYKEVVRRLENLHGREPVRWYNLMRIVLTWALWRRPESERPALLQAAEAGQSSLTRKMEVRTMSQTIAEAIFAEGKAEGKAEGALATYRQLLRRLLEERFGPLNQIVNQRIENAADLSRLDAAVVQVHRLASLEDLQL
jgi:hypothetical protein